MESNKNLYSLSKNALMISNKKTMEVSAIAIAAVIAVFAAIPFVIAREAQAFVSNYTFHSKNAV